MVKILLDTNIIIFREGNSTRNSDIGELFKYIDTLGYQKCIHEISEEEIKKHEDKKFRENLLIKLDSYKKLTTIAEFDDSFIKITSRDSENHKNDNILLNEVYVGKVDFFLTEDKYIHEKAQRLGIKNKVFSIDTFLEYAVGTLPELINYKVLSIRQEKFGSINLKDPFFDSLRNDYTGFDKWFIKKSEDLAYVFISEKNVGAFLFLKVEEKGSESYNDISPYFTPKKRLKIGTFKVAHNGIRLGERFMKIIFDNAKKFKVDEIYVTIFGSDETPRPEQDRLIEMLESFGFINWGIKSINGKKERVYIRDFTRAVNIFSPQLTYPYIIHSLKATDFDEQRNIFIVSVKPEYHTELLPDSILNTENPNDFIEPKSYRNAIRKIFVSKSSRRDIKTGDIVIFYRSKDNVSSSPAHYNSVITSIGIVSKVNTNINSETELIEICKGRSVYSDKHLIDYWSSTSSIKPFAFEFLYVESFPVKLTRSQLIEEGIINKSDDLRSLIKVDTDKFFHLLNQLYS